MPAARAAAPSTWRHALAVRGAALNKEYGLGTPVSTPARGVSFSDLDWHRALSVGSTALDGKYHLGRFAVPASAGTATTPPWLAALEARGHALNKRYHLGPYASHPSGFDLGTFAAASAAAAALLAALLLVRRSWPRGAAHVSESACGQKRRPPSRTNPPATAADAS